LTRLLHFDCASGAAGDMIVAALIHVGAAWDVVERAIAALQLDGVRISATNVRKQGFAATRFAVDVATDSAGVSRTYTSIREQLASAALEPWVKEKSIAAFTRLAEAESSVHGTTIEQVHFHEVGTVDAVVDVVAAMSAVASLQPSQITCSRLVTGTGTVRSQHGVLPVPAPATVLMLTGVPVDACEESAELLTPTGAAILTTLCDRFGAFPSMRIERVGVGAGTRDTVSRANVLRVLTGTSPDSHPTETVVVLEAAMDDASGELVGHCVSRLLEAGALDAYTVPIQMKKSRPGVLLTVICTPEQADALESIVFAETTTLGIRRQTSQRAAMDRRIVTAESRFGSVRIKVAARGDAVTASPEYEDCVTLARKHGVSLKTVIEAARVAWQMSSG